jgi:hypothetical protein
MFEPLSLIDLVLALVAAEFALLAALWFVARRGLPPGAIAANLAAGAWLLLAARAGLSNDTSFFMIALTGAGLAHVVDLALRFRAQREI